MGKKIEELHAATSFPDIEDISGAALGLIRLQDTYQLDAKSLARGAIGDTCCASELSVDDCFELGRQSYNAKHYDFAIQWFKEALFRITGSAESQFEDARNTSSEIHHHVTSNTTTIGSHPRSTNGEKLITSVKVSKSEILDYLNWAEDIQKTLDIGKDFLAQLTGIQLDAFVEQVAQAVGQTDESMTQKELGDRYKALCRGDQMTKSSGNPKLRCYYSTRNNPYYILGPIKEELVNLDPPIWSFKGVIHPGEIEKIKELAKPRVQILSHVYNNKLIYANCEISTFCVHILSLKLP